MKLPRWHLHFSISGEKNIKFLISTIVIAVTMAMHSSGCKYIDHSPNSYAGIIFLDMDFDDSGSITNFTLYDGKERGRAVWSIENTEKGTVLSINSKEVASFKGQAARSEVEEILKANNVNIESGMIDVIMKLLL